MNTTVIRVMLFPNMLAFMMAIMVAGTLANLSSGNRSGGLRERRYLSGGPVSGALIARSGLVDTFGSSGK